MFFELFSLKSVLWFVEGKNLLMFLMWKVFVLGWVGFVVVTGKQRLSWCVVCMSDLLDLCFSTFLLVICQYI